MRKKIRKSKVLDASPPPPSPIHNDLKFLVQQHSQFLDKLVEFNHLLVQQHSQFFGTLVKLIPTNFCTPVEDQEERWVQDLNKVGKAGSIKIMKKNGRSRLDPEDSSGILDLLKTNFGEENEKAEEENDLLKTNFGEENEKAEEENDLLKTNFGEENETAEEGDDLLKTNFGEENETAEEEENDVKNKVTIPEELLTPEEHRERFHRRMEELRSTRPLPPPLAAEDQVQPRTPDLSMHAELLRDKNRMELRVKSRMEKRQEREMVAAELRELNRMKKRLRSTRPLPPPLAQDLSMLFPKPKPRYPYVAHPYAEPNRMKRRLAKLKLSVKKRLTKRKQEMGAAGVKKQEVGRDTASKIEEEEVIKVAGRIPVKNRKIEKKKKSSCT